MKRLFPRMEREEWWLLCGIVVLAVATFFWSAWLYGKEGKSLRALEPWSLSDEGAALPPSKDLTSKVLLKVNGAAAASGVPGVGPGCEDRALRTGQVHLPGPAAASPSVEEL